MTEEQFRDLIEVQHLITELTKHAEWGAFLEFVEMADDGLKTRKRQLLNGAAKTQEEYVERTAFLRGAQYVLDAPARIGVLVSNERDRRNPFEMEELDD